MDDKKIIELEDIIFSSMKEKAIAASDMADIMGVLIDLKPAMVGSFAWSEFENLDVDKYIDSLEKLGLKVAFFNYQFKSGNKIIVTKEYYISKDKNLLIKLHDSFTALRTIFDNFGQATNQDKWAEYTKKIGTLLGYPKTAVDYFIEEDDLNDEARKARMARNQYYAHSAEHEDEEYETYDKKLNEAIKKYTKKTADYFLKNKKNKKGWSN